MKHTAKRLCSSAKAVANVVVVGKAEVVAKVGAGLVADAVEKEAVKEAVAIIVKAVSVIARLTEAVSAEQKRHQQ